MSNSLGDSRISFIHQNLQSIGNCVESLELLLEQNSNCKVLCCTEHWKTASQLENYAINGFSLLTSFCRKKENSHGGSAIFVSQDFKCKARDDIKSFSIEEVFECCAGEFKSNGSKFVIVCIYRPSGADVEHFLARLDELLDLIVNEKVKVFLLGDFNIDFLSNNQCLRDLLSIFLSYDLRYTIFQPTRITVTSSTCIHNIVTNYDDIYKSKVLNANISDHTAQSIEIDFKTNNMAEVSYRVFNKKTKETFKNTLARTDWTFLYTIPNNDVNSQWNAFMEVVLIQFEKHFIHKKKKVGKFEKKKSWALGDPDIEECKRQLDVLYVMKTRDSLYRESYNKKKKEYNMLLVNKKKEHFSKRLKNSDNKSKSAWAIVNEIKGNKRNVGIETEEDMQRTADNFNNFFANAATNALAQLDYIPFSSDIPYAENVMGYKVVDLEELTECVDGLKNKLSSG
nr:unnamed protein product [Callosobruchus analis]